MIEPFANRKFKYTGIDINPDQISAAAAFDFPKNVVQKRVFEGNAWDFSDVELDSCYDIIFTGMNLHHGTPEEVYCLLLQCKQKLSPSGVFINHDFYRPSSYPYMRRPQCNPKDPKESFSMIDESKIRRIASSAGNLPVFDSGPEWRKDLITRYVIAMKIRGAAQEDIDQVMEHVLARDYPISVMEMKEIASKAGFEFSTLNLNAETEPLHEFFSLVVAKNL
jgi:SAM-dependent methyltransferase